eukprot:SAG31_NODE_1862_length_7044_cov_11.784017_2_plen_150_part_00
MQGGASSQHWSEEQQLAAVAKIRVPDNVTLQQRKAIQTLRDNLNLIITESDKNQGLCVMSDTHYRDLGTILLSASADVVSDVSQPELVARVRSLLSEAIQTHATLLRSWENSPTEWKLRYIKRSLTRRLHYTQISWKSPLPCLKHMRSC